KEFAGIKVEKRVLAQISEELATGLDRDEDRIYALAGVKFNINSPKQLAQVLFEDLGLPGGKKTKSGYSTGQEVLENLLDQHEIIPYIIDYRQLSKLKSTYADALQSLIHPETGRVHTIFKQALTATGRLSSVEPNLQNIPIRMEAGRRIRKAFAAGSKETLLFTADYSQIDLRCLAHISSDETLIDTFQRGIDIHTRTAAEIFKVPLERVDESLRRRAKAVNFGIIYGISDFGLARDTGVSRKEAGRYIEEYLGSYPGVKQYMQDVVDYGIKYGYVETALGRRRYLPDLRAKNKMVQSFARRMALNTPIQGTSADIIKLAMIKVDDMLTHHNLKSRLLLQVHDELLLEVPRDELEETAEIVRNCMESAYTLKVPLLVSMKVGTNWYEMQSWE
ncbi:MAG TPA: DNA polymerase I, partial [Syntrophomonas sp.]|nr:DNA polymerase I [Syntrophomonas sp.]